MFAIADLDFLGLRILYPPLASPLSGTIFNFHVILDLTTPKDCKALQWFKGMISLFRPFLPWISPNPPATHRNSSRQVLTWLPTMSAAFAAKTSALPLAHSLPGAVLFLATDTSDTHVGAVLQQQVGQHWLPLGFYSKKLSKTEVNYSTFDRELLASISSIKHFRSRLEGRLFQLLADQPANLVYVPGMSNVVEDALSHPASGYTALLHSRLYSSFWPTGHGPPTNPLHSDTRSPLHQGAAHCNPESRWPGPLKGIVKWQRRGGLSGINRTIMTSHTIANVF